MARNRIIKPKFWDDTKIGKISRDARLLYIGMWNFSDDLGVVVGNPIWLKTRIFPYDQMQIQQFEKLITELAITGFIYLFSYMDEEFIYLPTFARHQTINRPNLDDVNVPKAVLERMKPTFTEQSLNNHGTITEQSVTKGEREIEREIYITPNGVLEETSSSPTLPACESKVDYERILHMYHTICTNFPKVIRLTASRKNKMRLRLEEMGGDYATLEVVFLKMQSSKFMQGDNNHGWKADFDWVFANDKNWAKILEGKYDNVSKPVQQGKKSELEKNIEFQQRLGVTQESIIF